MIFYFSGTGNSLQVAKKLSAGNEILNVASVRAGKFEDSEIGFIYPVHCGALPLLVEKFINESQFSADYIWAVATAGGNEGKSFNQLQHLLRDKNAKLNYASCIQMPDNSIAFKSDKQTRIKLLNAVDQRLVEIKNDLNGRVRNTYSGDFSSKASKLMWFGFKHIYGLSMRGANQNCIGCGQCVELCPTNNVKLKDGKPIFGKDCCYCFACIQWCPSQAIAFGRAKLNELNAYTNPTINVAEMIMRNK